MVPHPFCSDPFAVERAVTATHQAWQHAHPALCEAHGLAAMFPAALSPILPGDRFAGRFLATPGVGALHAGWDARQHHLPGLGFLPLTPGVGSGAGWYCHPAVIMKKCDDLAVDARTRDEMQEICRYWATRTIEARCLEAYPDDLAQLARSGLEGWNQSQPAHHLVRMTGPMLDFATLLREGLPGLRHAVCSMDLRIRGGQLPQGDPGLAPGLLKALEVIDHCARSYEQQARNLLPDLERAQRDHMEQLVHSLVAIRHGPPQDLHQALQLVLLYGVVSGAYSWGRIDDYLAPLYRRQSTAGTVTDEELCQLLCQWWTIIQHNGAPYDNRVIIGGCGREDVEAADAIALQAIAASKRCRLPLPQLSLRFGHQQDPRLYAAALDCLSTGATFPILYNDEVLVPAVAEAMCVDLSEAEQYVPYGCGEYVLAGRSFGTPSGIFNHTKILENVLRGGVDPVTGRRLGPVTPPLSRLRHFADLQRMYLRHLDHWIGLCARQQAIEYQVVNQHCGYTLWSLLYDDCLSRGRALFDGGVRYLGGTLESYGQINAGDSLYAIQRAVYTDRLCSAETLLEALDADFQGHEGLHRRLLALPKFGNDHDDVDALQVWLHEETCRRTQQSAHAVGLDSYLIVIINNLVNTVLGGHTLASADGRRRGEHFANAVNPMPGRDRSGLTALLNSMAKLSPRLHAGATHNLKVTTKLFADDATVMRAALAAYFQRGAQLMITVTCREELEAALQQPEQWQHLLVRVGGFSARFIDLSPAVQREVLERTAY